MYGIYIYNHGHKIYLHIIKGKQEAYKKWRQLSKVSNRQVFIEPYIERPEN